MARDILIERVFVTGSAHKSGVEVYLSRRDNFFYADVGPVKVRNPVASVAIEETRALMAGGINVDWKPALAVNLSGGGGLKKDVDLSVVRFFWGEKAGGGYLQHPWRVHPYRGDPVDLFNAPLATRLKHSQPFKPNETDEKATFAPPYQRIDRDGDPENEWFLPYDEELYLSFNRFNDRLLSLNKRLGALLAQAGNWPPDQLVKLLDEPWII